MSTLLYVVGVLIFVLALLASIGLHELGHLIPARRFGGKVTQYFVGFGPTVWSRKIGETEWGIKAIPLGGYVKILGMLPPGKALEGAQAGKQGDAGEHGEQGEPAGERVRPSNTGLFTQLIADARAAEWELVGPEDKDRLFYKLPWWQKVITMAGGPMVNLVIAFCCFWAIFATVGNVVGYDAEPVVERVAPCVVPVSREGAECTEQELAEHPTPAYVAGLKPGDRFVSFNGQPITTWAQMQKLIRGNGAQEATLGVERDGQRIEVAVTTLVQPRPTNPDDLTELEPVGFLGVVPVAEAIIETGGPVYTAAQMVNMTRLVVDSLVTLPVKLYHVSLAVIGVEERDANGPMSLVGGGRLAGEATANVETSLSDKAIFLLSLIGGLNLFLGMFNFVPLLPLDGGHIAGALFEGVRRGWARLRRRPDPGYVDIARLLPIAYVMASVLIVMSVILITADLVVPIDAGL
ncbi:MAG: site-2 protease family protein [Nocardioides sp.]